MVKEDEKFWRRENWALSKRQLLRRKGKLRLRSRRRERRDSFNIFCCRSGRNSKGDDWILAYQAKSTGATPDEAFTEGKGALNSEEACWAEKRRIIHVIEAIEETPPPASASKTPAVESATAAEAAPTEAGTAEAGTVEAANLESTLSDIDKMLLNIAAEEAATTAEETLATVPRKEKEKAEDTSEEKDFDFQNIIGQELSEAEKEELKDYAISCGYKPGALLFGGIDDESLGCLRDRTGAKVISTLSKSIGFSKLEADISRYWRQHIVGSLFYSNFKVKTFLRLFIVLMTKEFSDEGCFFAQSMLLSKALKMQQDLEDKKHEIIIEGLESKIKDHAAALD
jgi:hypothetical protein